MSKMTVKEIQSLCLERNISFYSYRLPGLREFHFGAQLQGNVKTFGQVEACGMSEGFILVPFRETENEPALFIREDIGFVGEADREEVTQRLGSVKRDVTLPERGENSVDRGEYYRQVNAMISILKKEAVRKLVLARGLNIECAGYENAPDWFEKLALHYPDAFVFLVSVPGVATWMGATPELFLQQTEDEAVTMALAGTRPIGSAGVWGSKELEEQAIVTDFVVDSLRDCGGWVMGDIFSKKAGNVEHLCTGFTRPGRLLPAQTEQIRRALHPTPAVGGFPVRQAISLIHQIEGGNRRYYAGYLGPVHRDGTFSWFVNLRCMEIFRRSVRLYVGGGITALSDPVKEWEETELKSGTLLDVIAL